MEIKINFTIECDVDINQNEIEAIFMEKFEPANALLEEERSIIIAGWEIE